MNHTHVFLSTVIFYLYDDSEVWNDVTIVSVISSINIKI